ncbi:MAG: hypothetical protein OXC25_13720 [Thiotrichales bacterium]|nr:hypothetical protein [Thiotrichales bacterium]MCY4350897.1 hypothetical protein [Thiotrichales bacterium]
MKPSTSRNSGLLARRLRSGAAGCAIALMLAALAPPAAARSLMAPEVITVMPGEPAVFTFTLPQRSRVDVRYAYRTESGTAKAGDDYEAKSGHVYFRAGETRAQVEVNTYDNGDEGDEDFSLVLSQFQTLVVNYWGATWTSAAPSPWSLPNGIPGSLPQSKTVHAIILGTESPEYEAEQYGQEDTEVGGDG